VINVQPAQGRPIGGLGGLIAGVGSALGNILPVDTEASGVDTATPAPQE
jgi:hypothetical protein